MRKALIVCGGLVAVVIAAIAAIFLFVDVNQFRGQIQSGLQQQLGREVTLGDMKLSVIPLSIRVADVKIAEDPNFKTDRPFATVSEIAVKIALFPLLRKELQVNSLVLRKPDVELVRNAAKKWNYESLASKQGGSTSSSSGGLQLESFEMEDGEVAVSELGVKNSRTEYDHIDLLLTNFVPGKPFHAKLSARLEGSTKDTLVLEGDGGPLKDKSAPFKGKLTVQDASLGAVQRFLNKGKSASLDGTLTAGADIASPDGNAVSARGRLEISRVKLDGTELKEPLKMDFDVQDNLESGLLKIASLKLGVDKVPLTASGEMNSKTSTMNLVLQTSGAELADVFTLAHLFGVKDVSGTGKISLDVRLQGTSESPAYSGKGQLQGASLKLSSLTKPLQIQTASLQFDRDTASIGGLVASLGSTNAKGDVTVRNFSHPDIGFHLDADKIDLGELQQLTADKKSEAPEKSSSSLTGKGSIRAGSLIYQDIVFQNVDAECSMDRNGISLSPIHAELFGGKQTGSITLDTRTQPPTLSLNTKLDDVDANKVLSATTSIKKTLYGLLAAQGNASMRLASEKEMTKSLNGNIHLNLTKGKLAGINLLNELASVAKFLGYAKKTDAFTSLVLMTGDIAIRDGVANTENLQLQMDSGSLSAAGTVNLVDQSLNLHVTTVLDKETSQKSGGSQIGGFLTTALANQKGELVIPAIVTGTFAAPRFAPDAARVADLKLKSILPGLTGPGAIKPGSGKSVLDAITGKSADGGSPAGGIFDMINSLKKKKPDQK